MKFLWIIFIKTFSFKIILATQKLFKSMHKTCITGYLRLKFWSGVLWSASRNKRADTVYLSYPSCRLWRSRPFLVWKYCKFFVGFWLCQYSGLFPSLFCNQCCYFQFYICILIFLFRFLCSFKITDMVVQYFFEHSTRWSQIVFWSDCCFIYDIFN